MAGRRRPAKASICWIVSRPRPIMAFMSLTVRAVTARAPATSTAFRPPAFPSSAALSARPHSRTTASSFSPVWKLCRSRLPAWSSPVSKMLWTPWPRPSVSVTP